MKFTPEQLEQYRRYERVREEGRFNMFEVAACDAARLSEEGMTFVMENYAELRAAAESGGQND